jgi:PAS domain-containing protein
MDQSLEAQLRATLNMIPAYTWYAVPSGRLTFVNERCADYLGLPTDHPLRFGADTGAAWDSHIPLLLDCPVFHHWLNLATMAAVKSF